MTEETYTARELEGLTDRELSTRVAISLGWWVKYRNVEDLYCLKPPSLITDSDQERAFKSEEEAWALLPMLSSDAKYILRLIREKNAFFLIKPLDSAHPYKDFEVSLYRYLQEDLSGDHYWVGRVEIAHQKDFTRALCFLYLALNKFLGCPNKNYERELWEREELRKARLREEQKAKSGL